MPNNTGVACTVCMLAAGQEVSSRHEQERSECSEEISRSIGGL